MPCGCCWCSLPSPAHSSQCSFLHTLVLLGYPQGLLPGAAPLSACPLLCLPPPLPGGAWASGWRVDFSSFCKQVVAVCQAGRRQAGAAPQPGCAKHRGTAWGGDRDTQTQRERDIQTQTDRQTYAGSLAGCGVRRLSSIVQPNPCSGTRPLPLTVWLRALGSSAQPLGFPTHSFSSPTSTP